MIGNNMDKDPLVSVIMNCYNGEKYLTDAIESVLAQSYNNWELIFWDNKSTDRSAEIFQAYKDHRLKYFYTDKHEPLYAARGLAIKQACGEFLAFLDCDDMWYPAKIKKQLVLFNEDRVGLVYSNFMYLEEMTDKRYIARENQLPTGDVLSVLLKKYEIGLLTIMIRKSSYDDMNEKFNPKYNIIGDLDFCIRFSAKWKFDCDQLPLAYCRLHDLNLQFADIKTNMNELEEWVFENENNDELSRYSEFFILKSNILRSISLYETVNGNRKYALRNLSKFTILFNKTIIVNLLIIMMSIFTPAFILKFFLSGNPRYE